MENIHLRSSQLMDVERSNNSLSLASKVSLVIPNAGTISDADATFADQTLWSIRENIPDARIIYMAGGIITRFERFVLDPRRDVFAIRTDVNDNGIPAQVNQVVLRILEGKALRYCFNPHLSNAIFCFDLVPRRIINPRCGANWQMEGLGNNQENDFVEPMGINFYRIHPNYFFRPVENGNRRVRIQGNNYGVINVCWSRNVERPRANMTNEDVNCRQINSDSVEIDLNNFCQHTNYIHACEPVFISVQGSNPSDSAALRCTEAACRFPDNMRFSVQTENLGCFNAAHRSLVSALTILLPLLAVFAKYLLK